MTDLFTAIPNALRPQRPAPDTSLRDALAALRCVDCGAQHPSFGEHVAVRHGRIGQWRCWQCWRMGQAASDGAKQQDLSCCVVPNAAARTNGEGKRS